MANEKRSGKERRSSAERRKATHKTKFMTIALLSHRADMTRRGGLDRREEWKSSYHKQALVEISQRALIKRWDSAKGKMTYLWDSGLKAITFAACQVGDAVEVTIHTHQGDLLMPGRVHHIQKIFTEHGFAAEMDVQFDAIDDFKRALINQIIWGD
jgi:hypothetical protein